MGMELWWLPSLVVFGVAAASAVIVIALVRRRAKKRAIGVYAKADARQRQAAIGLVRADDAVQAATDELGFAVAQFGDHAAHELRDALEASRRDLRDAFALQQKLDDAAPDAVAMRMRWTDEISSLAERATERLRQQTGQLDARRGVERNAPAALDALRRRQGELAARTAAGEATVERLSSIYAPEALAGARNALDAARAAREEAQARADAASARRALGSHEPVGDDLAAG
jgi:hypothetical protein